MFTEPSLEPVEAAMALMNLSERPALAVRLGEQEDINATQDQTDKQNKKEGGKGGEGASESTR